DELVYDENRPLPKLGGLFKDGFHAARMDGSVHFYSNRIEESTLRALITASGGEVVRTDALEKEGLIKSPSPLRQDDDKRPAVDEGPKAKKKAVLGPREQQSVNNLKQLMIALHSFHDANMRLPPAAIRDKKTGKPLLSWRVALLPYIEQAALYQKFKLDEPWDSPHNMKLAEIVVPTYAVPGDKAGEEPKTFYRVFVAAPGKPPQTAWQTNPYKDLPLGAFGGKLTAIPDGTSNTLGVVEAGEAVPWTKPDELPYDPKAPLPKLGGLF